MPICTTGLSAAWGLMIILIAVGAMNVAVMAALAGVIFIEKVWKYGPQFATATGVVLLAAALLVPWMPWMLPGLHMSNMPSMPGMPGMPGM